jgi:Tol biopolymer transport system component
MGFGASGGDPERINASAIPCISFLYQTRRFPFWGNLWSETGAAQLCTEGASMKRSRTALAVTFLALGVLAGCNDYNNSVQYDTGSTLTNLSPSGLPAGTPTSGTLTQCPGTPSGKNNPCFTLYVIASSSNPFSNTSGVPLPAVRWNGTVVNTTFIDTTNLSAQVPYSFIAKPGTAQIDVYQPTGQGTGYNGLSNALTFTIYGNPNPFPTLSSVSPTSAPYCDSTSSKCANVPITVTGKNFLPATQNGGSSVTITGASTYNQETAITVTSITPTQMKATVPGTLLCASGPAQINVINPPSGICLLNCPDLGGGDTNSPPSGQPVTSQTFTITNSTPINTCPAYVPPNPNPQVSPETPAVSRDGRYVAYASAQNGTSQILLHDTCLGASSGCTATTRTVSVAADGTAGNADSHHVTMTPDGRYVAFTSSATNLLENAPAGRQVYLRDTCNGAKGSCTPTTQLVSTDATGKLTGTAAILPSLSDSGRFVAFLAVTPSEPVVSATGVNANAASPSNGMVRQVFLRDTCLGASHCSPKTSRISSLTALVADDAPSVSRDGRFVTYTASQSGHWQIVLSNTCLGAKGCTASTRLLSSSSEGAAGNAASHNAVLTPDGRYIAFSSAATNLVDAPPVGRQVYLRDTCVGATSSCEPSTILVSTDLQGMLSGAESLLPSLSGSGRYVAFLAVTTEQSTVATSTPNSGTRQVFVRDTCLGAENCTPKTTRLSLQPGGLVAYTKPAGPAIAGLAKQVALADGKTATMFAPTVTVDDTVLLAIPAENR